MQRLLDLRIVGWESKTAYILGVWAIGIPLGAALRALNTPPVAYATIETVVSLAGFLLGARIFRGRGEPVLPPRPWWQMTARPKLSRRLGYLFGFLTVQLTIAVIAQLLGVSRIHPTIDDLPWTITNVLQTLAITVLYLNSAARLTEAGATLLEVRTAPATTLTPRR